MPLTSSGSPAGVFSVIRKFASVGVLCTLVDFLFFCAFSRLGVVSALANILSYSIGLLLSFALNRNWVFVEGERSVRLDKQFLSFLGVNLGGLCLSTGIIHVLVSAMSPEMAKLIVIPLTTIWNFALYRTFVFRKSVSNC